jgi:hypothetical protein
MLARMIGSAGDGLHDRLMDFSRSVSGANFFARHFDAARARALTISSRSAPVDFGTPGGSIGSQ